VGSLAAIITGFYCAGTYHRALAPKLTAYISGNYADTAAYLLIFTVALIAVWFLALAVSGIVKVTMTQWADRFFGGCFGLAKGVILTAVVLFSSTWPRRIRIFSKVRPWCRCSKRSVSNSSPTFHRYSRKAALLREKGRPGGRQTPGREKAESKKAATPDKKAPAPDKTEAEKKTDEVPRPELEPKPTDQPHHETAKPTGASAKAVPNAKQTEPSKPEAKKSRPGPDVLRRQNRRRQGPPRPEKTAPQPAADSEKKT